MVTEFRRTLTEADFTAENEETLHGVTAVLLVANTWKSIGYYTVPKGIRVAVGQRFDAHYYAWFEDSADDTIDARVRIMVQEPTRDSKRQVTELDTRQITEGTADKKLMPYAPHTEVWALPDSIISIEVMPVETVDLEIDKTDNTSCAYRIPVTYKKD